MGVVVRDITVLCGEGHTTFFFYFFFIFFFRSNKNNKKIFIDFIDMIFLKFIFLT